MTWVLYHAGVGWLSRGVHGPAETYELGAVVDVRYGLDDTVAITSDLSAAFEIQPQH